MFFIFSFFVLIISACSNTHTTTELDSKHEQSKTTSDRTSKTIVHSQNLMATFKKNELVNESDVIISGTAISQEVQKDFRGFPATDTLIQVQKVYKGKPGDTVEVRTNGGETDDMIYVVNEDNPLTFDIGEEVVVFLSNNKGSIPDKDDFGYFIVGQNQGKFSIDNQLNGTIENSSKTYKFSLNNLQSEIDKLEKYNKTHNVPKMLLPEGQEDDI